MAGLNDRIDRLEDEVRALLGQEADRGSGLVSFPTEEAYQAWQDAQEDGPERFERQKRYIGIDLDLV